MLRHILRRLLATLPTLAIVSVVAFGLLALAPDQGRVTGPAALDDAVRERLLDLPVFFNETPRDARARAEDSVLHLALDDAYAERSASDLARLGGAALPHVLPRLVELDPRQRARVALALAPVAARIGLPAAEARDPARAVDLWSRFWQNRAVDFVPATARRAVQRWVERPTALREVELRELDTFALPAVIAALEGAAVASDPERVARLTAFAADVTGHDDAARAGASADELRQCASRWLAFWVVHRSDYVTYEGLARPAAMLEDTRYARWVARSLLAGAGTRASLLARAPVTLAVLLGGWAFAHALGAAAALLLATRPTRGREGAVLAATIAAPMLALAATARLVVPLTRGSWLAASLALGAALAWGAARVWRAALLDAVSGRWALTMAASGAGPLRIARRALKTAALPLIAWAGAEWPTTFGGALVAERLFGLHGLGEWLLDAVATRDVSALATVAVVSAAFAAVAVLASDVAMAALDPRLGEALGQRKRTLS